MITVQGFSALQRDLADRIWNMDTDAEISEFVLGLPKSLQREAWVVMQMIIAAELDQYQDIDPNLTEYIRTL